MPLNSKKPHLIHQILQINDAKLIDDLTAYVIGKNQNQILYQITKPIHPHLDLETIKRAQGYRPINKAEFSQLIKKLDIQEPLEDLLAMLTK